MTRLPAAQLSGYVGRRDRNARRESLDDDQYALAVRLAGGGEAEVAEHRSPFTCARVSPFAPMRKGPGAEPGPNVGREPRNRNDRGRRVADGPNALPQFMFTVLNACVSTIWGVTRMIRSIFRSLSFVVLNSQPRTGMFMSPGIPLTLRETSLKVSPPITAV